MNKIITINNWKRPDMYQKVLEGLATNPEISEYTILNVVDKHPNAMFEKRFAKIDQESDLKIETHLTDIHMGCAGAKRTAFSLGFQYGATFVINLEDDIIPGASFLHFMEWGDKNYRENEFVHAIIGWSRSMVEDTGDFEEVQVRTPDKTYQAFGIWDTTWAETNNGALWFGIHWNEKIYKPKDGEGHTHIGEEFIKRILKTDKGSWGWPFLNYWRMRAQRQCPDCNTKFGYLPITQAQYGIMHCGECNSINVIDVPIGRKCVIPTISRCQNIGDRDGAFNFNPNWHRQWIHNTAWAENRPAPREYIVHDKS